MTPPKPARRRSVLLVQSWWEDRVLRGVARYAAEHHWELDCRMRWTHELPKSGDWRGDGIIAFSGVSRGTRNASRRLIDFVRAAQVPVVETQEFGDRFDAPKVVVPHEAIGRLAAEYFLGLKFRDLGFVTFDENPLERHRRQAFQQTVESAGATFHSLTRQNLRRALKQLPKPLALFAVNDVNALEVILRCRDAGFQIPEEIAVMGVDDTEIICDLAAVPLTSINCDFERQGYEAAALLDRRMRGERKTPRRVTISPRGVTVRRSTDVVAIPDLDTARVLRFLRDHFRERWTVRAVAGELAVPLRRLHTIFSTHVGHTLLVELTRLRIDHAKKLLADENLKLETVGLESGFSSRFHFTGAFRRVTGHTPKAFRQALRRSIKPQRLG